MHLHISGSIGDGGGGGCGGVGTLMVIVVVEEGKTYLGQVSLGTFAGGGRVLCDPPLSFFPSPYFPPSKQCNIGVCAEMLSVREKVRKAIDGDRSGAFKRGWGYM